MNKISYYIKRLSEKLKIYRARKTLNLADVTLFSQNCLGGVMYHDCENKFLSPTVNLYMMPLDFIRFVDNYKEYFEETPSITDGERYPIGEFSDGIKINFMHYETKEDALEKWEQRKKRVNGKKIFVICVERDGFDEEAFSVFKALPYPKVLFTRNIKWKNDDDCIFIKKYANETQIPDLIPNRMMYYKNLLPKKIKKVFM